MQISGSTVLVTGATGGIGDAIARALAGRGASLILSGTRELELGVLADELGARALPCDLAAADGAELLAAGAGAVDILIANAALPAAGAIDGFTVEQIDRALQVNLRAPIVLARQLTPGMVAAGRGHVVFMSSLAGRASSMRTGLYNASKFGLRGFAGALRADLHGSGVGVSTVFPGFIREAGMFAESGTRLPRGVGTRSPRDVADAVTSAIERNRGEVDVAPLGLRLSTLFASLAPDTGAALARRFGGEQVSSSLEAGQLGKR